METGTEVMELDNMDAIVAAFNSDDAEALMQASGQGGNSNRQVGLPRININYDAETEDGKSLTRGSWKMYLDGRFLYADKVSLRQTCLLYTSPSPRDGLLSRMPSSA